jgi:Zinc-finger of C2H2 type
VYNCTLCQVTVSGGDLWLRHLNGKWHRNTLKRSAKVEMNKIVNFDVDNTGTPDIGTDQEQQAEKEKEKEQEKEQICNTGTQSNSILHVLHPMMREG